MRPINNERLPIKAWEQIPNRRPKESLKNEVNTATNRRKTEVDSWQNKKQWRMDCNKWLKMLYKSRYEYKTKQITKLANNYFIRPGRE